MASLEEHLNNSGPITTRTEHSRKYESIQDVQSLAELNQLVEELQDTDLSIQSFKDIASAPKLEELAFSDETLELDICSDLQSLAAKILARVKSTVLDVRSQEKEFEIPDFVQYDALLKVEQQLLHSSVYICVVGRYNVGKTTLINALIGEEVLPTSISPETASTLYIQHDDVTEQSIIKTKNRPEPILLHWSTSTQVATGIENIKKHLTDLHFGIREKTIMVKDEDYLLKINLPIMHNPTTGFSPKPYLVDTPGSNEVGEEDLQKISELNLKSAAAYIFVMKYDDIMNIADYDAFKIIYERDPQIFQSERLTIVVTHFDIYFQNQQAQVCVADVKKKITSTLAKILDLKVSENIVFPVCGKWASDVRQCRCSPSSGSYRGIRSNLIWVKIKQSEEDHDTNDLDVLEDKEQKITEAVFKMSRDEVLMSIEKISMIKEVEERVGMVSKRLSIIWKQNIISSCNGFLKAAQNLMEHLESKYASEIQVIEPQIEEHIQFAKNVVEHHKALMESISDKSILLAALNDSYKEDIRKYEGEYKNKVEDLLASLLSSLQQRQRRRKYSITQLKEELNVTFHNEAEAISKEWLLQIKFDCCQDRVHRYIESISEVFDQFCNAGSLGRITPDQINHSKLQYKDFETGGLFERKKSTISDLKKCELRKIIKKRHRIRMRLPFVGANVIKENNIDKIVDDRRQALLNLYSEFFDEVKEDVILYFFRSYCRLVVTDIGLFISYIEEQGQLRSLQELNEKKEALSLKKQKKKKCVLFKEHFVRLSAQLSIVEEANVVIVLMLLLFQHSRAVMMTLKFLFQYYQITMAGLDLLLEDYDEVNNDDRMNIQGIPGLARLEHHRRIENIQDAENLEQLFELVEILKIEEVAIPEFEDIAQTSNRERVIIDDRSLEQDLCADPDLQSLATNILVRVKTVSEEVRINEEEFEIAHFIQHDALLKVEEQLRNSRVYICVLGRYNVGKTTLINALIGEDVLPVSETPETAITLYIQHDDMIKQSLEPENIPRPRLINWSSSKEVAIGIQNIREHLLQLHLDIRDKSIKPNNQENYLLKTNLPILQAPIAEFSPKPYLVDTPGSHEVGEGGLQKISELNLKSAAAYIFVMKYDDIKNKEDYEFLKIIHEKDPQIFQSEQLTIVVTHYDTYFQNLKAQLSVGDIKKLIAKILTKTLNLEVSENIVFPICGKWAVDSRLCRLSGDYNDVQMSLVAVERKQSKMNFMDACQKVSSMSYEEMLQKVENLSLITELEERLSMVTKRLSVIWRQNIISSCKGFLKAAQKFTEDLESKYAKEVRDTEFLTQYALKVVEHHKTMLDSISRESQFLQYLREKYDMDTKYEEKFEKKVNNLLGKLETTLQEKQRQRKYGMQHLTEEINTTFYEDAEIKMKRWLLQTKFMHCQRLLQRHIQRISEKFGRLRSSAASVVERGGIAPTISQLNHPFGNDDFGNIDDTMEETLTLTDLSICELNEIIKEKHQIRMKLPFVKANVINDDTLRELIDDRRQAIKRQHNEFFDGIKEEVILYFFKTYCNVVVKELRLFVKLIEEHGQTRQLQELTKMKEELSEKKKKKEKYAHLREHFVRLSAQLESLIELRN